MGREHGDDHRVILRPLGLVNGGGVGQLQLPQALQGVVRVAPVKTDGERPRLDAGHDAHLAVEHASTHLPAVLIVQRHVVVVLRLHHPVPQAEHTPAVG